MSMSHSALWAQASLSSSKPLPKPRSTTDRPSSSATPPVSTTVSVWISVRWSRRRLSRRATGSSTAITPIPDLPLTPRILPRLIRTSSWARLVISLLKHLSPRSQACSSLRRKRTLRQDSKPIRSRPRKPRKQKPRSKISDWLCITDNHTALAATASAVFLLLRFSGQEYK